MKVAYDFHIHTALSPCAEESMTPNNIINMAYLNELDVIAITDHNSCQNAEVLMNLSRESELLVIPGMEIESKEEIHLLALFQDIQTANKVQEVVQQNLIMNMHHKSRFGRQLLMDEADEIIGQVEQELSIATSLSMKEVQALVEEYGGVMIPAHIDRPSYSILANLGMIPNNIRLSALEISRFADYEKMSKQFPNYLLLQSSDAHELGYIGICKRTLEVRNKSVQAIFEAIRNA